VRPGGRESKIWSRRPGNTRVVADRPQNRILTGANVLNRAFSIFLTGSCAQLVGFGFDWGQGWSHRPKSGTANGLGRKIWQQVRAGGGWRDGVGVGRAFALALVRFVTAASARWVGLGGQVGAAVSPRPASRGLS
jgi:hypothetical protein